MDSFNEKFNQSRFNKVDLKDRIVNNKDKSLSKKQRHYYKSQNSVSFMHLQLYSIYSLVTLVNRSLPEI